MRYTIEYTASPMGASENTKEKLVCENPIQLAQALLEIEYEFGRVLWSNPKIEMLDLDEEVEVNNDFIDWRQKKQPKQVLDRIKFLSERLIKHGKWL